MGAWGPAIFSDDLAVDIRSDYRELLEDQVPDDLATTTIVERYGDLADDEKHVLWLALAASQFQVGRLDEIVRARALEVIDSGQGLELWDGADAKTAGQRSAALAKLRIQLTGEQRSRRAMRRPWRHETDLEAGAVLAFTSTGGLVALLRVARVDDHRVGVAPILELLDWQGRSVPPAWRLRRLKVRWGHAAGFRSGPLRPETFRVGRHRKKDPDWADSGFNLVTRLTARDEDESIQPWSYTDWSGLGAILERTLTV